MNVTNILVTGLEQERITVQSDISSSKRLLEEMATLLTTGLPEEVKEKEVYHLLLEREKIGNTGVGDGVAIPHSRCECIENAIVALITLENPVDYDSLDRQPVNIAFGLLVPQAATQEHLNVLAEIARLMSNKSNRTALASAKNKLEAAQLIEKWSTIE